MSNTRYIFGPVPSRRLGRSLGVDVVPNKLCTLDCVYCEAGHTSMKGLRRKVYVPSADVLPELRDVLASHPPVDVVTFSGSGEPTLNSDLGTIIQEVKGLTKIPIAVITSGTLLFMDDVRNDLLNADVVLPTLNAATQEVFEQICKPHPKLHLRTIIRGIKMFRTEYAGQVWLEVMLVRGINDNHDEILKLKEIIDEIHPDKIQLNTVVRPPAERWVQAVPDERLYEICDIMGPTCEVIGSARQPDAAIENDNLKSILAILSRRPLTADSIAEMLGTPRGSVEDALAQLEDHSLVSSFFFQKKKYYRGFVFGSSVRCG